MTTASIWFKNPVEVENGCKRLGVIIANARVYEGPPGNHTITVSGTIAEKDVTYIFPLDAIAYIKKED